MSGTQPKLECDLVMRGGITSGIVYPRAIAKLAETYTFRSIGGTSAGAIAAAATAAAAYGAKHGADHFPTDIKGLPERLAGKKHGKTVLERLFQPQPHTRRLFRVLMAGLGRENKVVKILRLCSALCVSYWPLAIVGTTVLLLPLLAVAFASGIEGWTLAGLIAACFIPAVLLALLGAAAGAGLDVIFSLPRTGYGMCSGSSNMQPDEGGVLPLTDWLHEFFQALANKPLNAPVTFSDLWGTKDPTAERDVELVLMTTNVTRGISQRFPFLESSWGQLFFKETEFEALFPKSIVEWMTQHPAEIRDAEDIDTEGYIALPASADLPILLGARMSLSFPFLLGAVPLYAADPRNKKDGKLQLERCWFSDGGLTSNFPIHFFDAPLPLRPTFGINLVPASVDQAEDEPQHLTAARPDADSEAWSRVSMPNRNSSGIGWAARFNRFEGIVGFFSALFDTARNWGDTELMAMPGYRDRIVHVALSEDEGGLNLNMPPRIITALGERGERAGELLAARFAPEPGKDPKTQMDIELTWDNHRWIRYRSFMAGLERLARRFHAAWNDVAKQKPWRSYEGLLERAENDKPKSYPLHRPAQYDFAVSVTKQFVDFVANWTTGDQTFDRGESSRDGGAPRPKSMLRMMPPGANDPRAERPV